MNLGVKGRPDLHLVARFLDALSEAPRSRSQLQRAAGVNYDIFTRYLALLMEKGYLVEEEKTVRLTDEGRRLRGDLGAWLTRLFGVP